MSIIDRAGEKLKLKQNTQGDQNKPEDAKDITQNSKKTTGKSASMLEQIGEMILDGRNTKQSSTNGNKNQSLLNVDIEKLYREGLLALPDMRDQLNNAYRRIKRPLLAKITGRGTAKVENGNFIMITSALPGEGKTFTALNLALSLAQEKDWQVILVDCDNARQTLTSLLNMRGCKGIFDALSSGDFLLHEILFETSIKNLFFVPSGSRYDQAAEMLSSKRMEVVLTQLQSGNSNRIILFDTPPLLGISESIYISEHVGQVLFVVKAGLTQRQTVADALQSLDHSKAIGFILNQVALSQDEDYGSVYANYKRGRVQ